MNDPGVVRLIAAASRGDAEARREIAEHMASNPLEHALFDLQGEPDAVTHRLQQFQRLSADYGRTMARLGVPDASATFLFDMVTPLAHFLASLAALVPGRLLVGIGGGPGVGKTTLSHLLADLLPLMTEPRSRCLSLSLDDFYLPRQERLRRGHKWRTLPGSHDTERLDAFVAALDRKGAAMSVPRYDLGRDTRLADERLVAAPDLCIFDGAMVGNRHPGYETLAYRIDFLIFLSAPVPLLKHWRFERERKIRAQSAGRAGFTEEQMHAFWNEALRPSIEQWVMPNADIADLVLDIGQGREVLDARRQRAVAEPVTETGYG